MYIYVCIYVCLYIGICSISVYVYIYMHMYIYYIGGRDHSCKSADDCVCKQKAREKSYIRAMDDAFQDGLNCMRDIDRKVK